MPSLKSNKALESRIKEIYRLYIETVCPLVVQLELYDGSFPVEILIEIRGILDHLAKSALSDSADEMERNVSKAESHVKMALLDCFKYLCVSLDDRYRQFEARYARAGLSAIEDGEFMRKVSEGRKDAAKKLLDARATDLGIGRGEAYEKYEAAFHAYSDVDDLLEDASGKAEKIKKRSRFNDWLVWISLGIGIAGVLVGVWGAF